MYDPVDAAMRAVGGGSPAAVPLVLVGGAIFSMGPCTAPRMIALVSLAGNAPFRMRFAIVGTFIAGLAMTYASFGIFAGLLGTVSGLTHWVYLAVGLALGIGGALTLIRIGHDHSCSTNRPRSLGGVFLLGGSFALVISPCCTPILLAVLSYCAQTRNIVYSVVLLSAFALGHSLPLLFAAAAASRCARFVSRFALSQSIEVVSGALMLCLSGYYLCIA